MQGPTHIKGRYQLKHLIGQGSFGDVYEAWDDETRRLVALKRFSLDPEQHEEMATRFLLEAEISAQLQHKNSLTVYDWGCDRYKHPFMVCELLKGESLEDRLRNSVLTIGETLEIIRVLLDVLDEAHTQGVIHRDIKPGNVFLCEGIPPTIKLLDFGIAKSKLGRNLTQAGQMLGTPYYISPEQIRESREIDPRADLYGIGALAFHCMTGVVPFEGASNYEIMTAHIEAPIPQISDFAQHLKHDQLQSFIARLLAKTPEERFESATHTLQALQELRGSLSPTALALRPAQRADQTVPQFKLYPSSQTIEHGVERTLIEGATKRVEIPEGNHTIEIHTGDWELISAGRRFLSLSTAELQLMIKIGLGLGFVIAMIYVAFVAPSAEKKERGRAEKLSAMGEHSQRLDEEISLKQVPLYIRSPQTPQVIAISPLAPEAPIPQEEEVIEIQEGPEVLVEEQDVLPPSVMPAPAPSPLKPRQRRRRRATRRGRTQRRVKPAASAPVALRLRPVKAYYGPGESIWVSLRGAGQSWSKDLRISSPDADAFSARGARVTFRRPGRFTLEVCHQQRCATKRVLIQDPFDDY